MTTYNISFHSFQDTLDNATFQKSKMLSFPSFLSIFKMPNNYNHTFIKPPLEIFNSLSMFDFNKSFYPQSNFTFNGYNGYNSLNLFNPWPFTNDMFVYNLSKSKKANVAPKEQIKDKKFDKMLSFILRSEGGYVANDGGQACNKGIQQNTYNTYRAKKGLPKRDVKNITNEEVKDIYYTMYYKASGADNINDPDKINDPELALYVFDTAVNMGVGTAKKLLEKSNNNADVFKTLRLQRYNDIAKNPSMSKYLRGWKNRVRNAENFANRELLA
jgi:hypothetical protein